MIKTIIFIGMMFSMSAQAAQTAKVLVDNANVLEKPQADSAVVGTVPKDTSIAVSNTPTNGFFKSRIPSGTIGWISGNDILTTAAPATAVTTTETKKERKKKSSSSEGGTRLLISGGLQMLSNTGFPSTIPTTGAGTGYGGTVEIQFPINEQFYWGGRAEYYLSSSEQTVSASKTQTFKFHTLPLMVGAMYVPIHNNNFRLGAGVYAGVSLMTSLTIAQSTSTASSTVTYSSSDLCELINIQASYAASTSFSVLGDFGYRLHSAKYPLSTQLPAVAFNPNYSGLVLRLGAEFKL
jgi:hypothetical protein